MASLMYGVSVLSCRRRAQRATVPAWDAWPVCQQGPHMAEKAGFTRFRKLDIDHSVNAFYEVRP